MDAARYFEKMHRAMSAQSPRSALLLRVDVQDIGGNDAALELRQEPTGRVRVFASTMGRRSLHFQLFRKGWQSCHNASGEMTGRFPARADALLSEADFAAYIRDDVLDEARAKRVLAVLRRCAGSAALPSRTPPRRRVHSSPPKTLWAGAGSGATGAAMPPPRTLFCRWPPCCAGWAIFSPTRSAAPCRPAPRLSALRAAGRPTLPPPLPAPPTAPRSLRPPLRLHPAAAVSAPWPSSPCRTPAGRAFWPCWRRCKNHARSFAVLAAARPRAYCFYRIIGVFQAGVSSAASPHAMPSPSSAWMRAAVSFSSWAA